MKIPRVVIAGVTSGVGKTSIAIGLMHGLIKQGYKVQGFKVGPDYIDPSYHTAITDRESRNLDAWLMGNKVVESFVNASIDADVSIVEGVMGLFDGISGMNDMASTAHIARLLKAPIILALDASKTSRSIAAIAYGFIKFDPRLDIAGVILNNIASDKHERYCLDALKSLEIPVLGVVRRNNTIRLEERHLGLIPVLEDEQISRRVKEVAEYVASQLDIKKVLEIAYDAQELNARVKKRYARKIRARIGLALDNSFNFYYADNLERLKENGAEIIPFSPINDHNLPDVDGLYIGGGFPEVLCKELAENRSMLAQIKRAADDGMPIYAECGGLMYLCKRIRDFDYREYDMVGLFDLEAVMSKRLTLNYTYANTIYDSLIIEKDKNIKGHEFHHSLMINIPSDARFAYTLKRGVGIDGKRDGIIINNTLASYTHIYFNDKMARRFVDKCMEYSNNYKGRC